MPASVSRSQDLRPRSSLRTRPEANVWLALGLYELDGQALYDSAIVIKPSGALGLHYRRIDTHSWTRTAPRGHYGLGTEVPVIVTSAGRTAVAICGDVFNEEPWL
jgi:predicted amidohydrolase